ncbi:hypothetical protein ZIOFF_067102 [Zingiber officinale]|uniref:Cyclin-like domain-containing protein n=1 Tax=Zingiber officinale TaxID=94328 RepID=A0A8J5C8Q1_ZINOF|nr:hypothetical protein ZIOFF_067102 [Zingiber officinale]
MDSDLGNQLTSSYDDLQCSFSISNLFVAEADQITSAVGAIDLRARREAVALVLKAQSDCNLKPAIAYLAVNYIDRYLSKREIPSDKPWIVRLLSVSCLSLASKMQMTVMALEDIQRNEGFVFNLHTIQRMELLVLGALDWRMRSITPFSFLPFFLSFFSKVQTSFLQALQAHAADILLKALNDVKMLEFKPSVMAASALVSATYEFLPVQSSSFRAALASSKCVDKVIRNAMAVAAATLTASSPETSMTVFSHLGSSTESHPAAGCHLKIPVRDENDRE